MVQPPTRRIAAGLFALLLVCGCGGGDDPEDPAADPSQPTTTTGEPPDEGNAGAGCPLTPEQVSEVLGIDVVASPGTCSFAATGGTYAEVHYAAVGSEVFSADEPTAVEGVGDEAYRGPSGELYVQSGDLGFQLQVLAAPSGPVDGDAAEEELARAIIDSQ